MAAGVAMAAVAVADTKATKYASLPRISGRDARCEADYSIVRNEPMVERGSVILEPMLARAVDGAVQFMCAAGESIAALPRKTSRSPTRSGSQTGAHVLPCPTCGGSGELPSAQEEDERKKVAVLQHPEVKTLATAKPPADDGGRSGRMIRENER